MSIQRVEKLEVATANQRGSLLIEALFAVLIFSIMGLAVTQYCVTFLNARNHALNHELATQLAVEKIEQLAVVDPLTLSNGEVITETVSRQDRDFSRVSTVTVNADLSRSVLVEVEYSRPGNGGVVSLSDTYIPWSLS